MSLLGGDAIVLAGATGRVGGATIPTLIGHGARLLVLSRTRARAQAAIDVLTGAERARAAAFAADLNDPGEAAAAIHACVTRYGRIDAVVSLAGSGLGTMPLVDSSLEDLRASVAAFTEVAYNLALPALRAMLAQDERPAARSRGRLVMVTAGSSKTPAPGRGLFGIAKAGVNVLMQAVSREHKADGIVANALVLGGVATEAARASMSAPDFAAAATPQEVADALAFLAADNASGINGALVDLNAREVD